MVFQYLPECTHFAQMREFGPKLTKRILSDFARSLTQKTLFNVDNLEIPMQFFQID